MKKVVVLFFAIIALLFVSSVVNAQETGKTLIISNFTTRAVAVEMPAFYKMAIDEAKGYSLVTSNANKMTGFITVVSAFDSEENAQCIKIRIANGKDMTILSFFNGWASEAASKFNAAGYTIGESNDVVTISKGEAKLSLKKEDFKKATLSATELSGWQENK